MEQKRRISVNLESKYAPWSRSTSVAYSLWARGYAFVDEQCYSEETLVRYLSDCLAEAPPEAHISILKDLIPSLNGGWALVYETNDVMLAAVDRFRSVPLFYAIKVGRMFLSHDAKEVLRFLNNAELDDICAAEFLVTGYVTGRDTLYKGLYQIQPGEILEAMVPQDTPIQVSTYRYYRLILGSYFDAEERELEEKLSSLWHRIFSRYAVALKGKTPIIPLSGGLDSRLVAAMLKKCGVENVICFSYGICGNDEAEASRAVASALGYRWLFCPYDEMLWYRWFREGRMLEYTDYASNYSSVVHIQDWPATREVLSHMSHSDLVFIPGHTGDFLTGGHITKQLFEAEENAAYDALIPQAVLSQHYGLWPWRNSCPSLGDSFVERVKRSLPAFSNAEKSAAIGAYETWDFENRQARYIINSVRVYEFFGCQWMLPWWDYELMDFFSKVKLDLRYQKKLYKNTLFHRVFVRDLSNLANIALAGFPLSHSFLYRALQTIVPESVKVFYRYRRRYKHYRTFDPLALYGRYDDAKVGTRLVHFLGSLDSIPTSAKMILNANLKRKVLVCYTGGINAAYYIKLWSLQQKTKGGN